MRYNFYNDFNNFYIGAGIGLTVGTDIPLAFNERLTVGGTLGAGPFFGHYSVNVNYHFNSFRNDGWVIGLEAGEYAWGVTATIAPVYMISLGYKF